MLWAVELRREESRCQLQDLIRPAQLPILRTKLPHFRGFHTRRPRPSARVHLRLSHPVVDGLRRPDPKFRRHRLNGRPLRSMLRPNLRHHPNSTVPQLLRVAPRSSRHDPVLPKRRSLRQSRGDSLVASDRAFDTPFLWRVFQINCWNRLMVRASATNSWSRERRAQAIHPVRSSSPRRPLVAKTARSCSLSRYARYSAELVVLILARLSCWSSVRSAGLFTTAQRALRSRSPACSRVRRRTRSRAFVPHITTWNGSRQIAACGAFSRTTEWIHSAPSAETCVSRADLVVPRASKNNVRVSLLRPSWAHTSRPVSWSTTHVRYRCPFR